MGRPSLYTAEIASEICRRLADGESLRAICRDEHMPEKSTVRDWALDDREGFSAQYARARAIQAYGVADELLEIADDGRNDWMETNNGGYEFNSEHVQRSRLRIDTRKWHLSKMLPKIYGDKSEVVMSGPNGGPVQTETKLSAMEPIEASQAYQRMMRGDK